MDDPSGEPIGDGTISYLASVVADGTATRDEATSLLREFVRQVNASAVTPRMIEHLRDCIDAYLVGTKQLLPHERRGGVITVQIPSLDKAFGLKRVSRGQPPLDRDTLIDAATDLLEARLDGGTHLGALKTVAKSRWRASLAISSETQVGEAWASHKRDALAELRLSRFLQGKGWTETERARLREIYDGEQDIVFPGENSVEGPEDDPP